MVDVLNRHTFTASCTACGTQLGYLSRDVTERGFRDVHGRGKHTKAWQQRGHFITCPICDTPVAVPNPKAQEKPDDTPNIQK